MKHTTNLDLALKRAALVREEMLAEDLLAKRAREGENAKDRERRRARRILDEIDETGAYACSELPWLRAGGLSYEAFIQRVLRRVSRRGYATITGIREPAKLRMNLRRAARLRRLAIRTWDPGLDLVRAGVLIPSVLEERVAQLGHEICVAVPEFPLQRDWHALLADESLHRKFWEASLVERVALVRVWRGLAGKALADQSISEAMDRGLQPSREVEASRPGRSPGML